MARIRNIKPDYFRHEALQDLEAANPCLYIMLTYIALWTQCDANGIFPWRPRVLKLDILPFIEYNLASTLDILLNAGYITQYTADDGNTYGHIPTFKKHQRITGKEAIEGKKYPIPALSTETTHTPPPSGGLVWTSPGNNRETPGKHPDAQEEGRITGKDNREREGVNAHAHEADENQNQKPLPDQICDAITAWAETDRGVELLKGWKRDTGYSDRTHGPTTAELRKYVAYHLKGPQRDRLIRDPITHFTEQFPGWLANATQFNRPKNTKPTEKPHWEPPPNGYNRTNTNGNATGITTIGDIAGKIITEIT